MLDANNLVYQNKERLSLYIFYMIPYSYKVWIICKLYKTFPISAKAWAFNNYDTIFYSVKLFYSQNLIVSSIFTKASK